jgi:quercetin dioxygenase-like cupin family protein
MKAVGIVLLLGVTGVMVVATAVMAQAESTVRSLATTLYDRVRIALTPEAISWEPVFDGAEIAVLAGDPEEVGSPYVIRVKYRDGLKVLPHWHSSDESITVISGTWVMGVGKRYDLSVAQEFPAGSYLVIPKGVPHFAVCRGETIVQRHGVGPLDSPLDRSEDDLPAVL